MKMMKRLLLIVSSAVFISSCTSLVMPAKKTELSADQWTVRGKAGIKTSEKTESASFYWAQTKQEYLIRLFGPLGMGAVKLQGGPSQAVLTDSEGHVSEAASPELLIAQNTGWVLPVTPLRYWIWGMPAPHVFSQKAVYNSYHQLILLQQEGWTIQYLAYDQQLKPHIIELDRPGIAVRLVINEWQ